MTGHELDMMMRLNLADEPDADTRIRILEGEVAELQGALFALIEALASRSRPRR